MIKRSIALCMGLALCLASFAQASDDEMATIFGRSGDHSHGGYGAITLSYTTINKKDAMTIGGRGVWIIDHNFGIGMGGCGFITEPQMDLILEEEYQINGGYGGLILEPIIGAKKPIHLSFPVLIGAGGVAYSQNWQHYDYEEDEYNYENAYESSDAYFVLQPGVEVEFNMLKFFRFAVSASYRYTSNVNLAYKETTLNKPDPNIIGSKDMLRSWNFGLAMKFGKF